MMARRGGAAMYERERLVESIEGLLSTARRGSGSTLFVVGVAGLGKSTALDRAREMAKRDVRVGAARGEAGESSLPFALLARPIERLGGPDLVGLFREQPRDADNRCAKFHEMLRWLESLGPEPVLFLLDDIHRADPESLALLGFLCRRLSGLPVGVIATLRPWPPHAHEFAMSLTIDGHASLERLEPLSKDGSGDLLAARLGHAIPETVVHDAHWASGGNPLLLEKLAAAIASGGDPVESTGAGAARAVDQELLARFLSLAPPEKRFVEAASVIGGTFDPDLVGQVGDLRQEELDEAVESLWASGLVHQATEGALGFVHPMLWLALYDALAPPRRARFHSRAFAILLAREAEAEAAEHALRSQPLGKPDATGVLERVGRAAIEDGCLDRAVECLQAAVGLAGESVSPALLMTLGQALLRAGRPLDAVGPYETAVASSDLVTGERAEAVRMLSRALFASGAYEEATERLEEMMRLAEEANDSDIAVEALVDHVVVCWPRRGPLAALPFAERACRIADSACEPVAKRAEAVWGLVALLSGDHSGLEALAASSGSGSQGGLSGLPDDDCWSISGAGLAAMCLERFDEAERAFQTALETIERIGVAEPGPVLTLGYPYLLCRAGRLSQAWDLTDRLAAVTQARPWSQGYVAVARGFVLHQLGRIEESEDWCARAVDSCAGQEEWASLFLLDLQGQRHLDQGRTEEACETYRAAEEMTVRLGVVDPYAVPWLGHALASYLACRRVVDATRIVEWAEGRRFARRWPAILGFRGRAGLAEHADDDQAVAGYLEEALSLHDHVDLPVERAETLLQYASFLRRKGAVVRARALAAEALRLAEACQAGRSAIRAKAELRLAGGRRRKKSEHRADLTPAEGRVARLAAKGRSNREIAGSLVISVNTVESHLKRIYAKLGVGSRRELMTMGRGPTTRE